MISNFTDSPGFIGFEETNATVVGDVFLPIQPFWRLNDLKLPSFISSKNEDTFDVLSALLLTCSIVLSPALVEVTVTESDMPVTSGIRYTVNEPVTSKAKRMTNFNNTLLINRKISLSQLNLN